MSDVASMPGRGQVFRVIAPMLVLHVFYAWDRVVLAIALPDLAKALALTPVQTGIVASCFTLGLAAATLPAGFLVRRMGGRAVAILGAGVFSLMTAYVPFAQGFADLVASRLLMGAGEGLFSNLAEM